MLKSQLSTSVISAKVINESIRQLFLFKHVWYSARHNCFEAFQIGIRDSWCRYNKFLGPILSFFLHLLILDVLWLINRLYSCLGNVT